MTESSLPDIPAICPVLGIPITALNSRRSDDSISIDRVDSQKGYVDGNLMWISWRANRIKADASSDELRLIADYIDKHKKENALKCCRQ